MGHDIGLDTVFRAFRDHGARRVFLKKLSTNDNSKNQIYLGSDFGILQVFPSGDLVPARSSSEKRGDRTRQILKSSVRFIWLDSELRSHPAPNARLILYPQYPEVRFSGFLAGSSVKFGDWFDPYKKGRTPGRSLLFGVLPTGDIYGYLVKPDSALARELESAKPVATFGALMELGIQVVSDDDAVFSALRRINDKEWIFGKRLDALKQVHPCNNPNCGGYTLEAELGITPNGYAEPDYLGWEVKTFGVTKIDNFASQVITLMTPEPDGGVYREIGAEGFVRKFGYPDVSGRPNRLNFGGIHKIGVLTTRTRMRLDFSGVDSNNKIADVSGGIALMRDDECAALWTFSKLIDHWKRKHAKAVYVPHIVELGNRRRYRYGETVIAGRGANFTGLLEGFKSGAVYYDPGIKVENASTRPLTKRRSQFRIKVRHLALLYEKLEHRNLRLDSLSPFGPIET